MDERLLTEEENREMKFLAAMATVIVIWAVCRRILKKGLTKGH